MEKIDGEELETLFQTENFFFARAYLVLIVLNGYIHYPFFFFPFRGKKKGNEYTLQIYYIIYIIYYIFNTAMAGVFYHKIKFSSNSFFLAFQVYR